MAANVLGQRVNDDIGTKFKWFAKIRGCVFPVMEEKPLMLILTPLVAPPGLPGRRDRERVVALAEHDLGDLDVIERDATEEREQLRRILTVLRVADVHRVRCDVG